MAQEIKKRISEYREYLLLLLAICNIIGIALAAYITIRLAPIDKNMAILATEIEANTRKDDEEHSNFVTKDTFNGLVTRLDHISNRVDAIYARLVR